MKYFINATGYAPLYLDSEGKRKLLDLSYGALVEKRDVPDVVHPRFPSISYVGVSVTVGESPKRYEGYITSNFLEPYIEMYPQDLWLVDGIQTQNPNDAPQYVIIDGRKEVNMCGELCISKIAGVSLISLIERWKAINPSLYKRIFRGSKATGTTANDLKEISNIVRLPSTMLSIEMLDPIARRERYTPTKLSELVLNGNIIVSVNIDGNSGRLRGQGIGHWVTVEKVIPDRAGFGQILIWNPFSLRKEMYSWQEFIASARNPYGLFIKSGLL